MTTRKINLALEISAKAHDKQYRKGTDIPYISHPVGVGMYLLQAQCSEELVIAGILHDTLEDTELTPETIAGLFGSEVLKLVQSNSEPNKNLSWEERKAHTHATLKVATRDEQILACADKLHNALSMIKDYEAMGEDFWGRFKRGKEQQAWYYRGIVSALLEANDEPHPLFLQLKKAVDSLF